MTQANTARPLLDRLQQRALIVGAIGLALCVGGFFSARPEFFQAYLVGFLLWTGVALGCFAVLLLHHIFGAGWGFVIQRTLEAGTRTFPLLAGLFIPLYFGLHDLYEWTHTEVVAADPILSNKSAYLNVSFFSGRAVLYFAVWIGVAHLLNKWSRQMDEGGDTRLAEKLPLIGPPGLLVYGLTVTFASVDWAMSLDPHWFSTMFGLIFVAGQVLSALALVIIVLSRLAEHEPMAGVIRASHFHDLGNLLMAFTMIWAYLSFSQFLITWSGNLPETIPWYLDRSEGGWQWLALGLFGFSFALPFALLLSRRTKRNAPVLAVVATLVFAMRLAELIWVVKPAFFPGHLTVHWLDIAVPVGLGGLWVWFFLRELKSRPLLPQHDPRMTEALAVHAGGH